MTFEELTQSNISIFNGRKILIYWNDNTWSLGYNNGNSYTDSNLNTKYYNWSTIKTIFLLP